MDPRWVLATRTAELLQGDILIPERREKLLRLGKLLGLTAFDANLIIAIVQDQARRGIAPQYCPSEAEPQLRMVPLRHHNNNRLRQAIYTACLIAMLIAVELMVLNWMLR